MNDSPELGFATYAIVQHYPAMGRTRLLVRCKHCGGERLVYLWSWAGHGKTRCCYCGRWWKRPDERFGRPKSTKGEGWHL